MSTVLWKAIQTTGTLVVAVGMLAVAGYRMATTRLSTPYSQPATGAIERPIGMSMAGGPSPADGSVPFGLYPMTVPDDNPITPEKVELGKQLFFDKRLSVDDSTACTTCHDPNQGFSNAAQFAKGVGGKIGRRNVPTLLNSGLNLFQFWDGRAPTLEAQALQPITNPEEMGMPSLQAMEKKLNQIAGYRKQFQAVFGTDVTAANVAKAIATFERTLLSADAAYDRYQANVPDALSPAAKRGHDIFFTRGRCARCHANRNFINSGFENTGVGMTAEKPDLGRQEATKSSDDAGSFKTPTLRDIARTAPYMHDGSMKTLEEVVEHYRKGGIPNANLDDRVRPVGISDSQKADLVAFLKEGLAGNIYPKIDPPELPK